ncbi:hypothetical protein AVEN_56338-1 [Araneus ventricosus]|uniref:Uncharacterized protein n=1 Tax=Araneus ventricosus TaxID=182803 RepID=A0A4Y2P7N9_ARAVE|nr:hypothetical protein AVEN_56338-1 [Araneus ventricosus]
MKRHASIQNFFAKNQSVNRPVSDSAEVDSASNNVSSGVANTSTVDPAPVAEDFNQVKKNIYDIGNYCQSNSVRSLTNEEKISPVGNVWKHKQNNRGNETHDAKRMRLKNIKVLEGLNEDGQMILVG